MEENRGDLEAEEDEGEEGAGVIPPVPLAPEPEAEGGEGDRGGGAHAGRDCTTEDGKGKSANEQQHKIRKAKRTICCVGEGGDDDVACGTITTSAGDREAGRSRREGRLLLSWTSGGIMVACELAVGSGC